MVASGQVVVNTTDRFRMALPLDDRMFEEGYCIGIYEATVDQGPRIRLPRPVVKVLQERKVHELWRFPDPSGRRMILCPSEHRKCYIQRIKEEFSEVEDPGLAYRRYLCSGTPIAMKNHGRVSIVSAVRNHMLVEAGEVVVILGAGYWYELWKQDDWLNASDKTNAQ